MNTQTEEAPYVLRLISKDETVRALGISHRGIDRLVASGQLRKVKVGRRAMFHPDDIRDFIVKVREQR